MAANNSSNLSDFFSYMNLSAQSGQNVTAEPGSNTAFIGMTAVTVAFNCGALLFLFAKRHLWSPYHIYVVVLLFSNIVYVGIYSSLSFLTQSFRNWSIGNNACTLQIYNRYIVIPIALNAHVLIVVNRVWALFFPMSYRSRHSYTLASVLCFSMVLYVHVMQLPGVILDTVYYRLPLKNGCWVNSKALFAWEMFTMAWVYAPKFLIPLSYPFLLVKWLRWTSKTVAAGQSYTSEGQISTIRRNERSRAAERKRSRPFFLLTFMAISTAICWTPSSVYYALAIFIPANGMEMLNKIQLALNPLQAMMDPLIVCFSAKTVQDYLGALWQSRMRRQKVGSN